MTTPAWVDGEGRVHCAKCGERRGYSWDRETGEPICIVCEIAEIDALEAMVNGGASDA